jgi:hypothetical protein
MRVRAPSRARGSAVLVAASVAVLACHVVLAPEWDPVLDRGVADIAQQTDAFLAKMERAAGTPEGSYAANAAFYGDAAAAVRTLRLRAESSAKSKDIVASLEGVLKSLEDLRSVHEGRGDQGLPKVAITTARSGLETQFRSLFVIEAALRRDRT